MTACKQIGRISPFFCVLSCFLSNRKNALLFFPFHCSPFTVHPAFIILYLYLFEKAEENANIGDVSLYHHSFPFVCSLCHSSSHFIIFRAIIFFPRKKAPALFRRFVHFSVHNNVIDNHNNEYIEPVQSKRKPFVFRKTRSGKR